MVTLAFGGIYAYYATAYDTGEPFYWASLLVAGGVIWVAALADLIVRRRQRKRVGRQDEGDVEQVGEAARDEHPEGDGDPRAWWRSSAARNDCSSTHELPHRAVADGRPPQARWLYVAGGVAGAVVAVRVGALVKLALTRRRP